MGLGHGQKQGRKSKEMREKVRVEMKMELKRPLKLEELFSFHKKMRLVMHFTLRAPSFIVKGCPNFVHKYQIWFLVPISTILRLFTFFLRKDSWLLRHLWELKWHLKKNKNYFTLLNSIRFHYIYFEFNLSWLIICPKVLFQDFFWKIFFFILSH